MPSAKPSSLSLSSFCGRFFVGGEGVGFDWRAWRHEVGEAYVLGGGIGSVDASNDGWNVMEVNQQAHWSRWVVVVLFVAVPVALVGSALVAYSAWKQQLSNSNLRIVPLPELIPAPTEVEQVGLVAAIKKYPNAPIEIAEIVPLGADASGLRTLLAAFPGPVAVDGATRNEIVLENKPGNLGAKIAFVWTAGTPPRVIRRGIELRDNI